MKIPMRQAFQKHLQRRYSLRLHMLAILLATTLSGLLFAKALLFFGVVDFRARYPLAVVFSYLVFFVCIRLWLSCIASARQSKASAADWIDLPTPSFRDGAEKVIPSMRGSGGQFLGAGASGSFESPDTTPVQTVTFSDSQPTPGGGASKGVGDTVGKAVDVLGDDNIVVAVIVLVILIATILISAALVLYGAPAILAEAAFEGLLAASLIKRARTISDKAWAGSILKATWKPFAVTLGVAFLSGLVLHSYFPEAVRLSDIFRKS